MKKRFLALVIAFCMITVLMPMAVFAADTVVEGYCGNSDRGRNLSYRLDTNGVLTISGKGYMEYYKDNFGGIPWADYREQINEIVIEDGVEGIGQWAFWGCRAKSVKIPDTVKQIGEEAFGYSDLHSVTIPESVEGMGRNVFDSCDNLQEVTINANVETLENGTFAYCEKLVKVQLPETLKTFGGNVFFNCKSLVSVNIPDGFTSLSFGNFQGCEKLEKISIPESVETIDPWCCDKLPALKEFHYKGTGEEWYDITVLGSKGSKHYDAFKGIKVVFESEDNTETELPGATYPVVFLANGGFFERYTELETKTYEYKMGSKVEKPNTPFRDYYEFTGWYKDRECTTLWDFEKDTVEGATRIYAGWKFLVTIYFDLGEGLERESGVCEKDALIAPPSNPSKDGYFFAGWYKDKEFKKEWNFDRDKAYAGAVLYAKWEKKTTATLVATPSTQKVMVDGKEIKFNTFVLLDEAGNAVNFVKLRDVAYVLNHTAAQFNVDWKNNAIRLEPNRAYTTQNGAEMTVLSVIEAPAKTSETPVLTDGATVPLEAFLLVDENGGGHNYFKLRDIGKAAGFDVTWDNDAKCIVITTTSKYKG